VNDLVGTLRLPNTAAKDQLRPEVQNEA
jgi:hypothetical protein